MSPTWGPTTSSLVSCPPSGRWDRKLHRAGQGVLRLARIQPRVLDDEWLVGLHDEGVVGAQWNRFWVGEVVEPKVFRSPTADGHAVRSRRVPVRVEDRQADLSGPRS